MNWITEARLAHQGHNKPTEVDSMNRLRVQAEDKAALYRRALVLACDGDEDKVAFYVSEADAAQEDGPGMEEAQAASSEPERSKCMTCDWTGLTTACGGFTFCDCPKCGEPVTIAAGVSGLDAQTFAPHTPMKDPS